MNKLGYYNKYSDKSSLFIVKGEINMLYIEGSQFDSPHIIKNYDLWHPEMNYSIWICEYE